VAPDYSVAYLRLGMLHEAQFANSNCEEYLTQAISWYQKYHQFAPDDPLSLKKLADLCELRKCDSNMWLAQLEDYLNNREPEFAVSQELGNGWLFWGYDVDEARLVRDEPVTLWLYWLTPADATPILSGDNFYQLGDRRVQVVNEVQNIILNGSFEIGQLPIGLPLDAYQASSETRQLVTDVRYGKTTTVALLSNTEDFDQTSFVSKYFPIHQDKFYLQAGWLRGEAGNAYLARRWRGDIGNAVRRSYVIKSVSPEVWTHYAAIITPPNGATEARVRLNNRKTTGKVYFDNMIFVEIDEVHQPQ
jgi:hypothetical protein